MGDVRVRSAADRIKDAGRRPRQAGRGMDGAMAEAGSGWVDLQCRAAWGAPRRALPLEPLGNWRSSSELVVAAGWACLVS